MHTETCNRYIYGKLYVPTLTTEGGVMNEQIQRDPAVVKKLYELADRLADAGKDDPRPQNYGGKRSRARYMLLELHDWRKYISAMPRR